ncbi:uncharacterized protein B0H64DRAFT_372139 [Chaetomium fimeti]|uniref:Uncharacterized protein n=1 Tax=Chaetomium fimeti TaxID=1854472 RepID=A0AAE0HHS9_9PEZI|nr:hypothetical protein B0H64DRAFT_372139 [Chaetomium fimeti]
MSYFETITDIAAFEGQRSAGAKHINQWKDIPHGSKWSATELRAARLLVRKGTNESNHMLPALRSGFEKGMEDARNQEKIQDLLEGLDYLDPDLTSTEDCHRYGTGLRNLWADLAHYGDIDGVDNPGYVVPSSVSKLNAEQATVRIASSFIQTVVWSCPPQHDTYRGVKPAHLVDFSQLPLELAARTGTGAKMRATADSQLISYRLGGNNVYNRDHMHCPALDGLPVVTDSILGQLTCEALALRLSLTARAGEDDRPDEDVFVIAAAGKYMRFLQFKISDAYVSELVAGDGEREMTNFVELWATP